MNNKNNLEELRDRVASDVLGNFSKVYKYFKISKGDLKYIELNSDGHIYCTKRGFELKFTVEYKGIPLLYNGQKVVASCILDEKTNTLNIDYGF